MVEFRTDAEEVRETFLLTAMLTAMGTGRRFAAALLPRLFRKNPRSHHKGAPVGFELETNGFQRNKMKYAPADVGGR